MKREQRGAIIVTAAPIVLLGFLLYDALHVDWDVPRQIGFTITAVFLVLLTIARIQLGANFSITPQARQLVTTGVYSKIRNPIYVFSAPAIAGFLLYLHHSLGALVFLAIIIPIQWLRARSEARVLEERFGQQYRDYRANTWF